MDLERRDVDLSSKKCACVGARRNHPPSAPRKAKVAHLRRSRLPSVDCKNTSRNRIEGSRRREVTSRQRSTHVPSEPLCPLRHSSPLLRLHDDALGSTKGALLHDALGSTERTLHDDALGSAKGALGSWGDHFEGFGFWVD